MILGERSSGTLPLEIAVLSSFSSATEVAVDFGHEFLHVLTAVVASHVVVKVLPDPLDPIVIRAIGREKVKLYLPPREACRGDGRRHPRVQVPSQLRGHCLRSWIAIPRMKTSSPLRAPRNSFSIT